MLEKDCLKMLKILKSRKIKLIGLSVIALQVTDGLLTYAGLAKYGIKAEANPFLANLMVEYGVLETLVVVKFLAIVATLILMKLSSQFSFIREMLAFTCVVYTAFAVLPWSFILIRG
ncbi:MAG TPA: DUF5658 family protein [Candidatus Dojkabacteria bacterium]